MKVKASELVPAAGLPRHYGEHKAYAEGVEAGARAMRDYCVDLAIKHAQRTSLPESVAREFLSRYAMELRSVEVTVE